MATTTRESEIRAGGNLPPNIPPDNQNRWHDDGNHHLNRHDQRREARENGEVFRLIGLYTIAVLTNPVIVASTIFSTQNRRHDFPRKLLVLQKKMTVDRFTNEHRAITGAAGIATIFALSFLFAIGVTLMQPTSY